MSDETARKMMQVASVYGSKYELSSYLPPTALYELAAPKTPLEVRKNVEALLVDGQKVTVYPLPLTCPQGQSHTSDRLGIETAGHYPRNPKHLTSKTTAFISEVGLECEWQKEAVNTNQTALRLGWFS
ncbi:hypothetical protein K1W69_07230 [Hoeflea sp. WL0058]|uniref:Uncharacterized protein n=1 Tax=Flavimaribacter sediminis TaxID=2865987 RepID=A0AAE2ZL76_9HYPH|nr:hypothetical protein [Flavimaribacter sediminis]MBW8636976.1 hypothetical protein [Flavimaribacter sediminis]